MEIPSSLQNSRFTESLIVANGSDRESFAQWVFEPGMLFNAPRKWWGDREKRKTPHEGLDVCLYRHRSGGIHRLDAGTTIPALADGVAVKIFDDLLGKSLFIKLTSSFDEESTFFIFYGHTLPLNDLRVGQPVKQGDPIAAIADVPAEKSTILPHLHISLGWTRRPVDYDRLDWRTIGERNVITLIDPVDFLDWGYGITDKPAISSQVGKLP